MTRYQVRRPLVTALLLSLWAAVSASAADVTRGYNCLFMGHSFFSPIAKAFADHPGRCGYPQHRQTVVFHGGQSGAPGMLWESSAPDVVAAKALLETGTVDLLGLTYFPEHGSDLPDYRKWVDLALAHNARTRFIIHAPWARYRNRTLADYEAAGEHFLNAVHQLIDQLRAAYPGTTFLCIPQARWMVGLWRMFDDGRLPEVIEVQGTHGGKGACLFRDTLGHGGQIPVEMGALLWLAVIYQVDLSDYNWQTNTKSDLKKLAQDVYRSDPYCVAAPVVEDAAGAPHKQQAGGGK